MSFLHFLLHFLVSSTFFSSCMANNEVPIQLNDDVLGLIVFKSHLNDPSSSLSSWSEDDDSPCSWKFLKCNPVNGRVSHVLLDGLGLSGKLGKGLQKLQHLKVLSLSNNNFSGQISHDISLIPNLEKLNLSRNSFTGIVPFSFVNLSSSMKFLDLSDNLLSGPVPDNLFQNLFSLRYVSLSRNSFQGPLPSSLANCSSLNTINLSDNHFSELFSGIWSLSHLRTLDLSNNEFSESVPIGLSNLYNLKELHLHGNRFSGSLPVDIGLCVHLIRLDLSNNLFTGVIPDSVQFLRSLTYFNLSNNMFGGDFPQWIGKISNLEYLDFSGNVLTGSLPLSISDLKSVSFISVCNNKLTGEIPATVVECSELSVIRLKGNSFNGSIPERLFDLGLEEVDFSDNNLIGSIPSGSSRFYGLIQRLDLSRNSLTGNITAEMGLSSDLRYLNLSWNNLQSRMPQEVGYFQNLAVLDLRNSFVFGSIPADICESGSLSILQLDGNALVGPIPEEIGNCSTLYLLSLSHNSLSGPIPKSISKLNKLEILQLESNKLSGEIPLELGKLQNLLAVNISYNMLTGRLPSEGIFPSLDQSALQGNLGICSPLLKGPCKMNVPKPLVLDPFAYGNQIHHQPENESSESTKPHHHMLLSVSAIIAISASVFIVIGVVVISILNISVRKRLAFVDHALESLFSSSSRSGNLASTGKFVLFGTKSSSDDITNPESLLNKAAEIGEGVFGTVYKVPLSGSQGSRIVAIKKLVTSNIIQNPEDFDREVRILGKAKHPNLVSLTGYYWTPQAQLLVSEFLPNGSLQAKLHGRLPSTPPLSWSDRFKIVLGTAKGIAHLHHSFRPPIIHYNIKPNNILLDENNNPKISDFGLARLLTKLDKHAISSRFQSAYVAPELACRSLRVNEKCDVYGFGILILELVTGRRPIEYGEDNVVILNDHVRFLLEQGNALDCVDHSMGDYPEDEVLPVLKLALVCTSQIPSSRPSMAEVVQILQVIKTPVPQRMDIF